MKITKILVALLFSFAVSTAYAGELSVSGAWRQLINQKLLELLVTH